MIAQHHEDFEEKRSVDGPTCVILPSARTGDHLVTARKARRKAKRAPAKKSAKTKSAKKYSKKPKKTAATKM